MKSAFVVEGSKPMALLGVVAHPDCFGVASREAESLGLSPILSDEGDFAPKTFPFSGPEDFVTLRGSREDRDGDPLDDAPLCGDRLIRFLLRFPSCGTGVTKLEEMGCFLFLVVPPATHLPSRSN